MRADKDVSVQVANLFQDLKARIPVLFYEQHFTVKEICAVRTHLHGFLKLFGCYKVTIRTESHRT